MPADLSYLQDHKFAVVMVADDGSDDGDWVVLAGIAKWRDGALSIDRGADTPEFPIPETAFDRVHSVAPEVKHILYDAEFSVTLSVGPIPSGDDPASYDHTGFHWPD